MGIIDTAEHVVLPTWVRSCSRFVKEHNCLRKKPPLPTTQCPLNICTAVVELLAQKQLPRALDIVKRIRKNTKNDMIAADLILGVCRARGLEEKMAPHYVNLLDKVSEMSLEELAQLPRTVAYAYVGRLLTKLGANVKSPRVVNFAMCDDCGDSKEWTSLMLAVYRRMPIEVISHLISLCDNIHHIAPSNGSTALQEAVRCYDFARSGYRPVDVQVVKMLVMAGAKPDAGIISTVSKSPSVEALEYLLENGGSRYVNDSDPVSGRLPALLAVLYDDKIKNFGNRFLNVQLLLNYKADLDLKCRRAGASDVSALHLAAMNDASTNTLALILEHSPNLLFATDSKGWQPLQYAIANDRLETGLFLLEAYKTRYGTEKKLPGLTPWLGASTASLPNSLSLESASPNGEKQDKSPVDTEANSGDLLSNGHGKGNENEKGESMKYDLAEDEETAEEAVLNYLTPDGSSCLLIAARNSSIRFLKYLIDHYSAREDPRTLSNKLYQANAHGLTPLIAMIEHCPEIVAIVLNISKRVVKRIRGVEEYNYAYVSFDNPEAAHEHPINAMIRVKGKDILAHDAVHRLLVTKWKLFGKSMFMRDMFYYSLLVIMFSVLVIVSYDDSDIGPYDVDTAKAVFLMVLQFGVCIFLAYHLFQEIVIELFHSQYVDIYDEYFRKHDVKLKDIKKGLRQPLVGTLIAILQLVLYPLMSLARRVRPLVPSYFFDVWNFLDNTAYLLVAVVMVYRLVAQEWLDELAAITIVLLWLKYMQLLAVLRDLGPFVKMITGMLKDIAVFFLMYLFFHIGFSMGFYILLRDSDDAGYQTWHEGLMTLYLMMLGDFDYESTTSDVDGFRLWLVIIFFVLYSLSGMLLLLNLLIAMMANTYQFYMDNAENEWRLSWATYIMKSQGFLHPDKKMKFYLQTLQQRFFRTVKHAEASEDSEEPEDATRPRGFANRPRADTNRSRADTVQSRAGANHDSDRLNALEEKMDRVLGAVASLSSSLESKNKGGIFFSGRKKDKTKETQKQSPTAKHPPPLRVFAAEKAAEQL